VGVLLQGAQGRKLVDLRFPLPTIPDANQWGARLLGGPILYFPIRHHSPACSWHLTRLIRERRPQLILIEGPSNFDQFRELLSDAETAPPIALYSYCNLRASPDSEATPSKGESRHRRGAYYPLSAYSPEWVALQIGTSVGAEVRFIDLAFSAQVLVDNSARLSGRVATLLAEQWFQRSAYLRNLADSMGCRDVDELWDRLFESWARDLSTKSFVSHVATYCELARHEVTDHEHERDGTTAREAEMAWHIAQARLNASDSTILVITGGYHTIALPALVATCPDRPLVDQSAIASADTTLIRYSFDRLDRSNGYGAGMPSPAFYQRLWETGDSDVNLSLKLLLDISHLARKEGIEGAPTTVSVIAALEQTNRLAALRGNRQPTRSDLLDAINSCYLQSAPSGEGRQLAVLTQRLFTGANIGRVPSAAGLPPIVADFYLQAAACGLKIEDSDSRRLALDVYGDARSRSISRLLHRLQYLEMPFASRLSGPSFTSRQIGRRLREVWQYSWSPQTESALIDAATYGSTIGEAAAQRFTDSLQPGLEAGSARSAQTAAERLSLACLLGLHAVIPDVLVWLSACVREDPHFESVVSAVHRLTLLWQAREPLAADGLVDLPTLGRIAFERATFLIDDLGRTPQGQAHGAAVALVSLREVMTGEVADWFDSALLWPSVEKLASTSGGHPIVLGAAVGMLYSAGKLSDGEMGALLLGRLAVGGGGQYAVEFLHGMLLAAREVAWQSESVLSVMRSLVESSDEAAFVKILPQLRLALSVLTPAETDHLAQTAAGALGLTDFKSTVEYALGEAEVQHNLESTLRVRAVLMRDGLGTWLSESIGLKP